MNLNDPDFTAVSDEAIARQISALSNLLAARHCDGLELGWKGLLHVIFANHPCVEVRAEAAGECSLELLQRFVTDPEPFVRWVAASNRFTADADIQAALAADPDERVVLHLLHWWDPSPDALKIIIEGPHNGAKRVVARRSLAPELLELLAADPEPTVRRIAALRLERRAQRLARLTGESEAA